MKRSSTVGKVAALGIAAAVALASGCAAHKSIDYSGPAARVEAAATKAEVAANKAEAAANAAASAAKRAEAAASRAESSFSGRMRK